MGGGVPTCEALEEMRDEIAGDAVSASSAPSSFWERSPCSSPKAPSRSAFPGRTWGRNKQASPVLKEFVDSAEQKCLMEHDGKYRVRDTVTGNVDDRDASRVITSVLELL